MSTWGIVFSRVVGGVDREGFACFGLIEWIHAALRKDGEGQIEKREELVWWEVLFVNDTGFVCDCCYEKLLRQ